MSKNAKKTCCCYGGFDCPVCNPEKYQKPAGGWGALMLQASKKEIDVVPKGFSTIEQISAETKKSVTNVRLRIKQAMKEGSVEMQKFRIDTGDKPYPTKHYKIIP